MPELSNEFQAEIEVPAPHSPYRVIRVVGEIDIATVNTLRAVLDLACDQARYIVVDMAEVDFMDASGVSALILAANRARESSGELILQRPSRFVRRVLDILSLGGTFPTEDKPLIPSLLGQS